MAQTITHGVQTGKQPTSVSTPVVAATGIIFAVGTAPIHTVDGKVNKVIFANNYEEAVMALGYSDDWKKYGLSEVIYSTFKLYKTAPLIMVNVLDPAKHKKTGSKKEAPVDNQIKLPLDVISDSVKVKSKTAGTDFEVFYNDENCIIEFTENTTAEVEVEYDEVDISKVTKADVIGGFNTTTHETTGLELIESVFPLYRIVPDLILCPNWSHISEVAAVMSAKAENINAVFEADAIIDIDTAGEDGVKYYADAPRWKQQHNFTKTNELVCFPRLALGDLEFNYSTQLAGLISQVDNSADLGGGTPCESASNKTLQADRTVFADGTEVMLDLQAANLLNDNGIITGLNFVNGFVSWGDYTAAFPNSTDPVDYFYCVSRMFKWIAKTVTLSYWKYIDRSLKRRLIDAVLEGVNSWLTGLTADEKIIGGRVELREDENTLTALMQGRAKFHIYITPPSPLVKMEFVMEYDVSYLANLLAA